MNDICNKYPSPPPNESCLYMDQNASNEEAGCVLNSLLIGLCSDVSKLIGSNFNIDIAALYSCLEDLPDEKDIPESLLETYKYNNIWPQAKRPALVLTKILKSREISLPIRCSCSSSDTQDPGQNIPKNNCDNYCWISIKYRLDKFDSTGVARLKEFHTQLRNSPAVCNIDLYRLINPYNEPTIPFTKVGDKYIFTIDNTNTHIPLNPLIRTTWRKQPHVLSCIGYSCSNDKICYTFQDSYSLDEDDTKPRIFDICISKNIYAQYISNNFGFLAGLPAKPLDNVSRLKILSSKQEIKDQLSPCCVTPTPTPTITPTPTPTIALTPTPTPTETVVVTPTPSSSYTLSALSFTINELVP